MAFKFMRAPIIYLQGIDLHMAALLHNLERVLATVERRGDEASAKRMP